MKQIIILSGGMDSTTLLYDEVQKTRDENSGDDIYCSDRKTASESIEAVSFNYGQRHSIELVFAEKTCQRLGIPWKLIDLTCLKEILSGSALTSDDIDVPEGHYASESMKETVVPNRNMIMLAVATGYAISRNASSVSYAAHAGDHAIYPDCRKEFADALGAAIALCDWKEIQLRRPYVGIDKAEIVRIGSKLNVPYEHTWSCYKGSGIHCGACGTCIERREAFDLANVNDPTQYDPNAPNLNDVLGSHKE